MKTPTTLKTKEPGLDFWQGRETFLFSKEPIEVLGPTHPFTKWAQGFKRPRGLKLTTRLHLVRRLKISGTTPPIPHMSSWSTQRQRCLQITDSSIFKRVRKIAKVTTSFVTSVRPSAGKTRLPLDGFS